VGEAINVINSFFNFIKKLLKIKSPSKMPGSGNALEYELIETIVKNTPFSLDEVRRAYILTKSFDLVLFAIQKASTTGVGIPIDSLVEMTDTREGFQNYMTHRWELNDH